MPFLFLSVAVVNSSVQVLNTVLYCRYTNTIPVVFGIGATVAWKENVMRNVTFKKSQNIPLNSVLLVRNK